MFLPAKAGPAPKWLLRFVFVLIPLFGHFEGRTQKSTGTFTFFFMNSGRKIERRPSIPKTAASVFYDTDTLRGLAKLSGKEVVFTPQNDLLQRRYIVTDEKFKGFQFRLAASNVSFVKRENKGKLIRLLFDAYGLKIYDDALLVAMDPANINYSSLLFEYGGKVYPAVTFWTTSTKRHMIKILNGMLGLS